MRVVLIRSALVFAMCAFGNAVSAESTPADEPASTNGRSGGYMGRSWALGPFTKLTKPIISPNPDASFHCPVSGKSVQWEQQNVYNPAAVVRDGKVHLLYRADDTVEQKNWNRTCRTGLAVSSDGRQFTRNPEPVIYPDNDACKQYEWVGGIEDIHITEDETGVYYAYYTAWSGTADRLLVATSTDLRHWKKLGSAFGDPFRARTGVVVSRREGEKLIATKINGKYWMYFGYNGTQCYIATSDNLVNWEMLLDQKKEPIRAVPNAEAGAIALLVDEGILFMYNAQNTDPEYPRGWSVVGQALMDRTDPTRLLDRLEEPFLHAQLDWELEGFCSPALVSNGLVFFQGQWLLYYGGADRWIGLACFTPKP